MIRKHLILPLTALLVLGCYSCNEVQKVLKSSDRDYQYKRAMNWYNQKEYDKAMQVMDQILPAFITRPEGEDLYYKFCYAHYYEKDYYLAGYYFRSFTRQYPYSKHTEECHFMSALCLVQNAPDYYLDQTDTEQAIEELQLFMDTYPGTDRKDTVNLLMDQLWGKLERKRINSADLFYDMEQYRAAAATYASILEDFPESSQKERLLYRQLESEVTYAENSLSKYKTERYEQARKTYTTFVTFYPESSTYMSEVRKLGVEIERYLGLGKKTEENAN